MALPASENTTANRMCYVIEEAVNHAMLTNDTGADLNQGDFTVISPFAGIADSDISSGSEGSVHIEEGIGVQTSNLKSGEDTFGTLYQSVYWDAVNLEFSDTETADYYLVGYLVTVKNSNGVIKFEKLRYAELVTT